MRYADSTTLITENAKDLEVPENQGDQWKKMGAKLNKRRPN